MTRRVPVGVVAAMVVLSLLPACSGGGSNTQLTVALATIADNPNTRAEIQYDDTAALVDLAGASWSSTKGFAPLRGYGSGSLASYGRVLADSLHLRMFDADYGITAGRPPRSISVLRGGQGSVSLAALRKWGWRTRGDRLVAPSLDRVGGNPTVTASLTPVLAQVRSSDSNLVYGSSRARLDQADTAGGFGRFGADGTLAGDPRVGALADCLGDVVAADILGTDLPGGATGIAVGVRRPDRNTDTPHAVACVSWSGSGAEHKYASRVRHALTSGTDLATGQGYATVLRDPSVRDVGGSQHLVAWDADTLHGANQIFEMLDNDDLPALVKCSDLPPVARSRVDCV